MHTHWPWWLGALSLAAIAVGYVLFTGRGLGVSGHLGRVLSGDGRASSALFLGGLVLGGLVAAGGVPAAHDIGATYVHFFGRGLGALAVLGGGGVLVGFGTALAGGCTSGHGLVGCARLQPGSLVATACFFGTAVAVSFLLQAVLP